MDKFLFFLLIIHDLPMLGFFHSYLPTKLQCKMKKSAKSNVNNRTKINTKYMYWIQFVHFHWCHHAPRRAVWTPSLSWHHVLCDILQRYALLMVIKAPWIAPFNGWVFWYHTCETLSRQYWNRKYYVGGDKTFKPP